MRQKYERQLELDSIEAERERMRDEAEMMEAASDSIKAAKAAEKAAKNADKAARNRERLMSKLENTQIDSTDYDEETGRKKSRREKMNEEFSMAADSLEMNISDDDEGLGNDSTGTEDLSLENKEVLDEGVDSLLLAQQIAELEEEMQNMQDLKDAERAQKEGKSKERVIKIKIPDCVYPNSVNYTRKKFAFNYEYNFFMYYMHHTYFYKRKLYDKKDSTRIMAKKLMTLVGNSPYRRINLNKLVDSVSVLLPGYDVETFADSMISNLNLEYLNTGEIKVKYKNRKQSKIYAKLQVREGRNLGHIKFYTHNKRNVIEQLNGEDYEGLLPPEDTTDADVQLLADSIARIKARADSLNNLRRIHEDSLEVPITMDRNNVDSLSSIMPQRDNAPMLNSGETKAGEAVPSIIEPLSEEGRDTTPPATPPAQEATPQETPEMSDKERKKAEKEAAKAAKEAEKERKKAEKEAAKAAKAAEKAAKEAAENEAENAKEESEANSGD